MKKNKKPASAAATEKPVVKKARPKARVFKSKSFARAARKEGIDDKELCEAAKELEEGKGEDLGGNVWKKRLNENRSRSIVATKPGSFWLFTYLFSKNDRENIDPDELEAFRKASKDLGSKGIASLEKLAKDGSAMEICNDCENDHHKYEDEGNLEAERAQGSSGPDTSGKKAQERGYGRRSRARK